MKIIRIDQNLSFNQKQLKVSFLKDQLDQQNQPVKLLTEWAQSPCECPEHKVRMAFFDAARKLRASQRRLVCCERASFLEVPPAFFL